MSPVAEPVTLRARAAALVGEAHAVDEAGGVRAQPAGAAEIAQLLQAGLRVGFRAAPGVVALDLSRMRSVLELDETSLLVTAQAGLTVEGLEVHLRPRGLSLGPVPEGSRGRTLGAFVGAPRPSEASPRFGTVAERVARVAGVLADGTEVQTRLAPRKATGPEFAHAFVGGRGTVGVVTAVTLRIARRLEAREAAAFKLPSFEAAVEVARALMVAGARPLELAVLNDPALLVATFEGPAELVTAERTLAEAKARAAGGVPVPHQPPPPLGDANEWAVPYARALEAARAAAPETRAVGFHARGFALVAPGAPSPPSAPGPLWAALKTELDPDGRLPAWPGEGE